MAIKIKVSESRKDEAEGLKFLPEELKGLEFELPPLYHADSLAIFKGSEDVDPDLGWDASEYMSWDVEEATTSGEYLMVGLKGNPGADRVKEVMASDYKKAMLDEPLELAAYLDVDELRKAFATQVVDATNGKDWELNYSMADIIDSADAPGMIDAAYTDYGEVMASVGAFGFTVNDFSEGNEIHDTKSADEALKLTEKLYNKYKA